MRTRSAVCRWLLCHSASTAQYPAVRSSGCVSDSCRHGWITEKLPWLASRLAWSTVFNPFSTLQLGRSPIFVVRIILQTFSPVFTGSEQSSELNSSWWSFFTDVRTVLRLSTSLIRYNTLLTCRQEVDSVRRLLVISTSVSHALSLSATAHIRYWCSEISEQSFQRRSVCLTSENLS